jgi:hypothetical protein
MPANLYMLSLRLEFAEVFMLEKRIEGCCTMGTAIKVLILVRSSGEGPGGYLAYVNKVCQVVGHSEIKFEV